jgi:hypothetical protein
VSEFIPSAKYKVTVTTANNEHDIYACHRWVFNREGSTVLLEDHRGIAKYLIPLFNVRSIEFKDLPEGVA